MAENRRSRHNSPALPLPSDVPENPPEQPVSVENVAITLTLTAGSVNVVLGALTKLPYADVAQIIASIKQQGDAAIDRWRVSQEIQKHTEAAN